MTRTAYLSHGEDTSAPLAPRVKVEIKVLFRHALKKAAYVVTVIGLASRSDRRRVVTEACSPSGSGASRRCGAGADYRVQAVILCSHSYIADQPVRRLPIRCSIRDTLLSVEPPCSPARPRAPPKPADRAARARRASSRRVVILFMILIGSPRLARTKARPRSIRRSAIACRASSRRSATTTARHEPSPTDGHR